jgi:hypothetical protein
MTEFFGRVMPAGGGFPSDDDGDAYELWDAAYVMGSLSSTERREYEAHLSSCPSCRASVSELTGMPALLAMLDRDEIAAADEGSLEPPPLRQDLRESLLAKVSWRRRRTRFLTWTVSAVAAAVLAIGVVIAIRPFEVLPTPTPPRASALAMTHIVPSEFDATVSLSSRGWGTYIEMTCTYNETPGANHDDDAGDKLEMVAIGRDGTHTQLATWMANEGVTAAPSASTSMPIDEIVAVQVVSADTGDVLLQRNL